MHQDINSIGNELYDILEKELKSVLPPERFDGVCKDIVKTSMKFYQLSTTRAVVEEQLRR